MLLGCYGLVIRVCGAADAGRLFSDSMVWTLMHVINLVWIEKEERFIVSQLLFPTKSVSYATRMCSIQLSLQLSDIAMHVSRYVRGSLHIPLWRG